MDLRHYDIKGHGLDMAYEDWKEGWDSPLGVANTSELTLWACASVPANADLVKMAKAGAEPAMLVCTPQYYHDQRAFGFWSLPDRSTAVRRCARGSSWTTPSTSTATRSNSAPGTASGTTAT